jgi:hypothetical protein
MPKFIEDKITQDHSFEMYAAVKAPLILTSGELSSGVTTDADGKTKSWVKVNRTGNAMFKYEVRVQEAGGDAKYFKSEEIPVTLSGLKENQAYNLALRQIHRKSGVKSDFSTDYSYTTAKDTTAPAVPTGLAVTGTNRRISWTWTNPTTSDFWKAEVYRKVGAADYAVAPTGLTEDFIDEERVNGTVVYLKVRSIDRSGNASEFCTPVSGTVVKLTVLTGTAAWAPGTIVSMTHAFCDVTVTGCTTDYTAEASFSESLNGCSIAAVAYADKVTADIYNGTVGDVAISPGTVNVTAYPPD